ncbi:MAG TPA: hypothetical protein VMZ90_15090 [Vicinamibacterales bacterium]|nr:hypothetical protein [Vicinamibacterales bacterium]
MSAEDSFAIVYNQGASFGYGVRFLLRETGGKSGARIDQVVVYGPSGSDETSAGCWRDLLRVPALGRLDTFYTDQGSDWLLYCGPGSGGTTASPALTVIVTFTDDFGVTGAIRFPVSPRH